MKIVIAPDSFKGNLSAWEVAGCIEDGLRRVLPQADIIKVPLADGGDGTAETLVRGTGGRMFIKKVAGPLNLPLRAKFGILGDGRTAVIEMALASGLVLIPPKARNPLKTTTYGTGQLIKAALNKGCRKLIIGIGGSATVDGGVGMAQALGVRFLDRTGAEINRGGGALEKLRHIDISTLDKKLKKTKIIAASDVTNPLLGPQGAARVYGPQKGATPQVVVRLERCLSNLARVIKCDLGKDISRVPGAGAAGGLGAGLMAFLNAPLRPGVDIVMETSGLKQKLKKADLVITGEGRIDEQTAFGKAPAGVAKLAKKYNLPVVALAGQVSDNIACLHEVGLDAIFSAVRYPMDEAQAKSQVKPFLRQSAEQIARLILISRRKIG